MIISQLENVYKKGPPAERTYFTQKKDGTKRWFFVPQWCISVEIL